MSFVRNVHFTRTVLSAEHGHFFCVYVYVHLHVRRTSRFTIATANENSFVLLCWQQWLPSRDFTLNCFADTAAAKFTTLLCGLHTQFIILKNKYIQLVSEIRVRF